MHIFICDKSTRTPIGVKRKALVFLLIVLFLLVGRQVCMADIPSEQVPQTPTEASVETPTFSQDFQTDLFTGRACISVPIEIPPGRNGLEPTISLGYVSSNPNSWMGMGWALNLGFIQRSNKNGVPTYNDTEDKFNFVFQGIESELVSIGANEYRPKSESQFFKIQYVNPEWKITDKLGCKYYFGATADSRQENLQGTFSWYLSKIEDINGNAIEIVYTKDQGELYLNTVKYNKHLPTSQEALHYINFTLEDRADVIVSYNSGAKITTAKRLGEISVHTQGELVRKYTLAYEQSSSTGRSLLSSITEYGSDEETSLPPTTFTYTEKPASWNDGITWPGVDSQAQEKYGCVRASEGCAFPPSRTVFLDIVDINGDGLPDRVMQDEDNPNNYFQIQLNNGSGFETFSSWSGLEEPLCLKNTHTETVPGGGLRGWYLKSFVDLIDINGDGLPDRVMQDCDNPNSYFNVQINNGQGFEASVAWHGLEGFDGNNMWKFIRASWIPENQTSNKVFADLVDINGDGLPDRVLQRIQIGSPASDWGDFYVQLNNGSGFDSLIIWPGAAYQSGYGYYFAIRMDYRGSSVMDLVDLNGDGLPDRVIQKLDSPYEEFLVQMNNGSGFEPIESWSGLESEFSGIAINNALRYASSGTHTYICDFLDLNGDGIPDRIMRGKNSPYDYFKFQVGTGTGFKSLQDWDNVSSPHTGSNWKAIRYDATSSFTEKNVANLIDINGDGLLDRVLRNSSPYDSFWVQINPGPMPDLLTTFNNGCGGQTAIEYQASVAYDNTGSDDIPDLPYPVYTASRITAEDGLGHSYVTTYNYADGYFDGTQREFRGFGRVEVTSPEGNVVKTYFHQDDIFKGKTYKEEILDDGGNLFTKIERSWENTSPHTDVNFVHLAREDTFGYDGDDTYKQTQIIYQYDNYGNITYEQEQGDLSITGDERRTITEYVYNTSEWILAAPSHSHTLNEEDVKVSEKWIYYDGNENWTDAPLKGLVTKEESWLDTASANPTTLMQYDSYGNLTSITDARGQTTTTTYETTCYTYPQTITNALGHIQEFSYDVKTGQILTKTDPNRYATTYNYDIFGRLVNAIGPNDTQELPGVIYEYDLSQVPNKITKKTREKSGEEVLLISYTFTDGFGRTVQTKTDAEDISNQIVSGMAIYDSQERVMEQYLPYFVSTSSGYSVPEYSQPKTVFEYDCLGRQIKVTNPDDTYRTVVYSNWVITNTDENGHLIIQTEDAYGRLVRVEEHNSAEVYATTYAYDCLGNLLTVTDNQGNATTITYDSLSRKISMEDPDMGTWIYEYDAVGNMILQTDAKDQTINFTYDELNRLILKDRPTGTDITYTYDNSNAPNWIGRLYETTGASGTTTSYYDNLGREIKTKRVIGANTHVIERTYDALNRLTSITYPNGEIINYSYNNQGQIESVVSSIETYVTNVDYNASNQIIKVEYGNGNYTDYTYAAETQRLTTLKTNDGAVQDLAYQFDDVGNILAITDYVNTASQSFTYDDLNRLTSASGAYGYIPYQYDSIGNMSQKGSLAFNYGEGTSGPHALTSSTDGSISCTYDASGNMLTKNSSEFEYDSENRLIAVNDGISTYTASVELQPGWNFLSLPVIPDDEGVDAVLSSLTFGIDYDQLSRFDAQTGKFKHYVNNGKFDQFSTIEYGQGYEIHICNTSAITLTISGRLPTEDKELSLYNQWNLIGSPRSSEMSIADALSPLVFGIDYDQVSRYDTSLGAYQHYQNSPLTDYFSTMEPGKSYFMYCLRSANWRIEPVQVNTTFVYGGDGARVQKITPEGTTTYISNLYEIRPDGTTLNQIFLGPNRIITKESTGNVYYTHQDHLGSSNIITDQAGDQVQLIEYTPYGGPSRIEGEDVVSHKFTGKELDDSTSLYWYGSRYYDPEIARFTQADTIVPVPGDPQSLNRYSYCRNNPLIYTDPTGHSFLSFMGSVWNTFSAAWQQTISQISQLATRISRTALSSAQKLLSTAKKKGFLNFKPDYGHRSYASKNRSYTSGGSGRRGLSALSGGSGAIRSLKSGIDVAESLGISSGRAAREIGKIISGSGLVSSVSDFINPDFEDPTSAGANFWKGMYEDPPTIGISYTTFGQTASVSTSGISFSETPTTLIGVSLDIQSWMPKSSVELGVATRHLGAGTFPFEKGVNPWAVHIGPPAISVPWVYGSITMVGTTWSGEEYGVLPRRMRRR